MRASWISSKEASRWTPRRLFFFFGGGGSERGSERVERRFCFEASRRRRVFPSSSSLLLSLLLSLRFHFTPLSNSPVRVFLSDAREGADLAGAALELLLVGGRRRRRCRLLFATAAVSAAAARSELGGHLGGNVPFCERERVGDVSIFFSSGRREGSVSGGEGRRDGDENPSPVAAAGRGKSPTPLLRRERRRRWKLSPAAAAPSRGSANRRGWPHCGRRHRSSSRRGRCSESAPHFLSKRRFKETNEKRKRRQPSSSSKKK